MYKGAQMDAADTLSLNPDATPTENSTNLVTSGGVFSAIGAVTENSAPAILNTASGAVCSFADGSASPMTSVIAEIVASQAGSGTPYPAGGGKNILPDIVYQNNTAEVFLGVGADGWLALKAGTYTISYGNSVLGRIFYKEQGGSNIALSSTASGTFTLAADANVRIWLYNSSGVTASDVAWAQLELGSTATAYAPYSNIRPISGYTGANVTRAGANVWNEQWELGGIDPTTGETTAANDRIRSKDFIRVFPSTSYYFKDGHLSGYTLRLFFYDKDKNFVSASGWLNASGAFTTGADVCYMKFIDASVTAYGNDISVNYPSSLTSYYPYAGEVFSVSWADEAGTVYGGQVDLVSGVLTVTHAAVDLSTLNWSITGTTPRYIYLATGDVIQNAAANGTYNTAVSNTLCSMFAPLARSAVMAGNTGYQMEHISGTDTSWISLRDSAIDDGTLPAADQIAAYVAELTGQYVVYPLVTPETYNLTPQEVASLLGANTLWNDVNGDTSAEYRADTKLYIQSLLGA